MTEQVAVHATIHGRVQGVWFRGWTKQEAEARGLTGWVRNMPDGTVEALFVGPRAEVSAMLDACSDGPPHAHVATVETRDADPFSPMIGFSVLR